MDFFVDERCICYTLSKQTQRRQCYKMDAIKDNSVATNNVMVELLQAKLNAQTAMPFSDMEIEWMLEHVGDPNPLIRDHLMERTMNAGFLQARYTFKQARHIVEVLVKDNLILYKVGTVDDDTVTRTFAALYHALFLRVDDQSDSPFYRFLTDDEHAYLFQAALDYLNQEQDFRGYDARLGWIHGFAHGADYLEECVVHSQCTAAIRVQALTTVEQIFHRMPMPFTDGEERRLAMVINNGVARGAFTQTQIATWIDTVHFDLDEHLDYCRLATWEVFLAAIFFGLSAQNMLKDPLEHALLKVLHSFSL
jgi:hypothetical protein